MSGVLYPDLARSFALGSQLRVQEEERGIDKEVNELVPAAMKGDQAAIENIARKRPNVAMGISGMLEKMDAGRRAKVKEASEWTTKAAMGVLSLPPEQRPAAYQAALADGQRLGYQIDMPPQYDRAVEGRLNQVINQARPIADYFKGRDEGFDLVPSGGGGAAPPAAGAPPNREAFLQTITPHALEVSKATGLDPRLVVAQSALETGYGQSAPGNNYFGVKSHGKPGGQVLATTEAGPNGMYGTRDSFRTYGTPGESARDYVEFLRTNIRYAPVLQAQGIDAQIEALGRSGYASDPQYAAKIRQIVQSLPPVGPQPAGREVAYGGNAAPMPQPPSGMAVPGTPAPMPQPPGIAQGDTAPPADASGTPIPTSDGGTVTPSTLLLITPNLPPGAHLGRDRKTGRLIVQEGNFNVYDINKNWIGMVPVPKAQGVGQVPIGYELNPDGSGLRPIAGGPADPRTAQALADAKRKADEKTIPQSVTKGVQENLDNLKEVDRALGMLTKTPSSVGGPGSILAANIPGAGLIQNWIDKDGTDVRAKIANIGSLIVHQRSGAAVTAAEFPRLKPFIPTISDDPATVKKKLEQFKMVYEEIIRDTLEYYGPENGFRPYTPATNYINRDQTPATPPPPAVPPPPAAPQPAPVPQQPAPQTPSPAERGRSQFDLKKKYGLE